MERGRDVKSFLKKFKTLVEDLPGITPDMIWNELPFRTAGLALRILDPFKDERAEVAIEKVKARYLRIWARVPRDLREILEEIVKGSQVKATDFSGLIGLITELEDYRRQATLHGDECKFDDPETLMAIVAARLNGLELKWSKFAIRRRSRKETVNFNTLITFIKDEATSLEEPEGAKARTRAHKLVGLLQRQAPSKKGYEKDKWGGRGGKFEPLIVNAANVSNSNYNVPYSQALLRPPPPPHVAGQNTAKLPPPRGAGNSSSQLSSQAPSFVPSHHAQFYDQGREWRVCAACKSPHAFYSCHLYLGMEAAARRPFAAKHRICFKCCNSISHGWRQCSQQHLKCFWCQSSNHHSTLHVDDDTSPEPFTDARLAGGPFMMGAAAAGSGSMISSPTTSSTAASSAPPS